MPSSLLVAGLDARSLLLEAPVLQRDRHLVQERTYARDLLREIVPTGRAPGRARHRAARPLACPTPSAASAPPPATREVSVLAILPAGAPPELEDDALRAGANAVLRRPAGARPTLEAALAKLLAVPRRVVARVPVQRPGGGDLARGGRRRTSAASPTT